MFTICHMTSEKRNKKINTLRSPRKSIISRKDVVIEDTLGESREWRPPARPRGHSIMSSQYFPDPDAVNLNNPKDRIEKFDEQLSSSNPAYGRLMRTVNNPTPISYPTINYDVDGNSSFPHMEKIVSKFSKSQMLATKRLQELAARRKELKQAESERLLQKLSADARAQIRDMYGITAETM